MRAMVLGLMVNLVATQVFSEVAVDPFEQALFVDLKIEAPKEGLRVRYSSRSTFRGLFGFGWCSPLDGRVVVRRIGGREQLFYYGCDQRSGRTLDPRVAGQSVRRRGLEYTRMNEGGQMVEFDSAGRVIKVGPHSLTWFDGYFIYRSIHGDERVVTLGAWYGGLQMVARWGDRTFLYSEQGLLVSDSVRILTYNRYRNIVRLRMQSDGAGFEEYLYDDARDRLRTVTRQTPNGVERLWLDVRGGDGRIVQERNEIEMELRRGAEMRPVRILYDRMRGALRIDGGQDAAALILSWLRRGNND
ncbi:MAG: hypothetical protein IPJ84_18580 [Bdellovibrionales bacterium]|nr:hypothetical protein [Bdellovibrionales bacterium]